MRPSHGASRGGYRLSRSKGPTSNTTLHQHDRNCHNNLGILLLERDDVDGVEDQFREGARLGDQLGERALKNLLDDKE